MTNKETIRILLRAMRNYHNVSQEIVRDDTKIDVSNYESGKHCPGIDNFWKLCDYFGLGLFQGIKIVMLVRDSEMKESDIEAYMAAHKIPKKPKVSFRNGVKIRRS